MPILRQMQMNAYNSTFKNFEFSTLQLEYPIWEYLPFTLNAQHLPSRKYLILNLETEECVVQSY